MGKLNFKNGQVEDYTIVLSNRELQKQGQISNVKGVKHNGNLASAQVINFTVYKHQLFPDREEENFPYESIEAYQDYIWENLVDFKVVYVKELNENFEIRVSIDDANDTIKTITGTSLCEVELGQTNLYNFEINSELDISRDDYEVTTFYNDENPNASLLHRVLSKVPHYKIKHVDKSLIKLQRTFSVDGVPIYDFLIGECSEQFSCLFRFDSTDRSVSVYDLMTVCRDCGERGEYTSVCPKCGSKNLKYFGQDTTIYVDKNNLTDSIHLEVDGDSIKNCFKLECGDEVMTAAVRALNPNGSDYIYRINENDRKDMPTELVNKIDSYDELYKSYTEEYHSITEQSYDLVDDILYYQSSMMPTIEESEVTAQTEADKLSKAYYDGNFNLVALTTVTTATNKTTVNSALKNYARIFVKTGYVKLDIEDDATFEYVGVDDNNWNYGTWYGRIKVTNYSDKEDIAYTDYMTITVNDNYHEFVTQKIQKNIKTDDEDGSVFDVLSIEDLDKFKEALTLYSLNRLKSFADAIQGALDILIELDQAGESADLYDILYLPYYEKLKACQSELDIRQAKIDELQHDLDLFEERRIEIQADLNFESYLGDLYPIFCAYRREDKFNNPNYISDGLDNSQLLQRAKEFWELAEKEIFKSSNGVITITSTLYNLLVMKEFEPLVKYFELGNWIRIRVDGQLYRLRLIGYEINFDSLQTINVTFSTVTKIKDLNVETEIESVIQSTKSMATSYSSVQKQAEKGREANDNVNSILQDGLNAGQAQITNNVNEEVTYGKHGILLRSYDDILGDFIDKQCKLTHNVMAYTMDNWKTVSQVIGEHEYTYYDKEERLFKKAIGYGVSSNFLYAGYVYGSQMIGGDIYSEDYDSVNGIGSHLDLRGTGNFNFGRKLSFDGTDLELSGKITVESGYIGSDEYDYRWFIGNDTKKAYIYNGTNSMTSTTIGTYLGTDGYRNYQSPNAYTNIQNGILTCNGMRAYNAELQGIYTHYGNNGVKALDINDSVLSLYNWKNSGTFTGSIGNAPSSSGTVALGFQCNPNSAMLFSYGNKGETVTPMLVLYPNSTPYIPNTFSGKFTANGYQYTVSSGLIISRVAV